MGQQQWSIEQTKEYVRQNPAIKAEELSKVSGRVYQSCISIIGLVRRPMEDRRHKNQYMDSDQSDGELTGAINADEFISKYDLPKLVEESLSKLKGKVIQDSNFRAQLGIDSTRWARVRELPQFNEYQISIKGKLWWAWPETIKEIENKLNVI